MINCDYIENTSYDFLNKCYINKKNIDLMQTYPQPKINIFPCLTSTNKWTEFYIQKIVDIPYEKPDIDNIIEIHSSIDILSQRIIKTPIVISNKDIISNSEGCNLTGKKLIIEGLLKQKIIYTAATKESSLHSTHTLIPFSTFIIVENNTPLSQIFKITSHIENTFAYELSSRNIFINITVFINALINF